MPHLCLLALLSVAAHPDSLSSSQVLVSGQAAHLTLRCQVLSLLEVVEGLDADGDGSVSGAEVEARSAEILDHVGAHYLLTSGTDREHRGGVRLEPEPIAVHHVPAEEAGMIGSRAGAVDVELVFRSDRRIRNLLVEVSLFRETSPRHIDITTIDWGDTTETFALDAASPVARSDPEGSGAFRAFLVLGTHHILGGWDHLCFLLALVLASRRLRSLLFVVTAFTLAHSVTLALAALGAVDVSRHADLVEAAIALSIAYVATDNLVHPHLRRSRWIEAFGFGLVHGLGFAGFLAQSLVQERSKSVALIAFNLGVEVGQVAVVVALATAIRFLPRRRGEEDPFLAPLWLRRLGSVVVAALGLYWFFERLP